MLLLCLSAGGDDMEELRSRLTEMDERIQEIQVRL
jgi:hypothetical protein